MDPRWKWYVEAIEARRQKLNEMEYCMQLKNRKLQSHHQIYYVFNISFWLLNSDHDKPMDFHSINFYNLPYSGAMMNNFRFDVSVEKCNIGFVIKTSQQFISSGWH